MEKITNVGGRLHNPVVGGALTGANEIKDDTKGKMQNVINQETDAELVRLDEAKQEKLTFDQTPTENSTNPVTSGGVYAADAALQQAIEAILLLIPSAASALNQLADKSFVNSSISTATATFRGTYNVVTDLGLTIDATHQQIAEALGASISTADNNDYCYVQVPINSESSDIRRTERYKFNGTAWGYEYDLNTSGYTAAQWAAINSGITAALVGDLNDIKSYIPAEATALNKLADMAYVVAQIIANIPAFKGQFTTLSELQAVQSPKAGDFGIVRTKDNDGQDLFTFYQYLNDSWNVYYILSRHPQRKPASTGVNGDYPFNGMGLIELPMNMREGWMNDTWLYYPVNGIVYLLYSWNFQLYAIYNSGTQEGLGLDNNLVVKPVNYNISDISEIVGNRYLPFTEEGGVYTITKPDSSTITSTDLNNTTIINYNAPSYKGVNVLTQDIMSAANTKYVIKYDYTLGEDIIIPSNCVLEFDGGSISGEHTITGNNTGIKAGLIKIVGTDVTLSGTWNVAEVYAEWFDAKGDGVTDDTAAIQASISFADVASKYLCLNGNSYKITQRQTINSSDFVIDGKGAKIIWAGQGLDSLYTGVFQFVGSLSDTVTSLSTDEPEYTNTITVVSTSGFVKGDLINITSTSQEGSDKYVNIVSRIVEIAGNVLTLDIAKRLPLHSSNAVVTKVNPVERSGIINCKFEALNQISRSNGMGGVYFIYAADTYCKNCSFSGFWFKGVKTSICDHVLVDNITIDKAPAFDGGEGYGVQFEFTYNSAASNLYGNTLRHLIDLSCAWHIIVSNCYDNNTQNASYSFHSAYEYDIIFENCIAQGGVGGIDNPSVGFALGAINTGFGDYADSVTLNNCKVYDFGGKYCIKFTSKGKGLNIVNSYFELRNGVIGNAILSAENDTFISNSTLIGGLEVYAKGGDYYNDGCINLSNCSLISQDSQRAVLLHNGSSLNIDGCVVKGLSTVYSDVTLNAVGCTFVSIDTVSDFITNSPTGINGQTFLFKDCTFNTQKKTKSSYTFVAESITLIGCRFELNTTLNAPWYFYGKNTSFISCEGLPRLVFSGAYSDEIEIISSKGIGLGGDKVIQVVSFTGKLKISDCNLNGTARTNNCIDLNNAQNSLSALIFTNNILRGIQTIPDSYVNKCVVTGNLIDAPSSTLPTAGANKFVENNLIY